MNQTCWCKFMMCVCECVNTLHLSTWKLFAYLLLLYTMNECEFESIKGPFSGELVFITFTSIDSWLATKILCHIVMREYFTMLNMFKFKTVFDFLHGTKIDYVFWLCIVFLCMICLRHQFELLWTSEWICVIICFIVLFTSLQNHHEVHGCTYDSRHVAIIYREFRECMGWNL